MPSLLQLDTALTRYDSGKGVRKKMTHFLFGSDNSQMRFLRQFVRELHLNELDSTQEIPLAFFYAFVLTKASAADFMCFDYWTRRLSATLFGELWPEGPAVSDDLRAHSLSKYLEILPSENRFTKTLALTRLDSSLEIGSVISAINSCLDLFPESDKALALSSLLHAEAAQARLDFIVNPRNAEFPTAEFQMSHWSMWTRVLLGLFPENDRLSIFRRIFPQQAHLYEIAQIIERSPVEKRALYLDLLIGPQTVEAIVFLQDLNRFPSAITAQQTRELFGFFSRPPRAVLEPRPHYCPTPSCERPFTARISPSL